MSNFKQKRWALWFLLLSGVLTLSSSQNVPAAVTALTAGVNIQMRIAVNASDLVLSQVHKDQIAQFFATQTRAACAPLSCTVQPATDIIFTSVSGGTLTFTRAANGTFTNASHTHEFSVVMRIMLPDNSRALAVKASSNDILKAQGLSQRQLEPNLSDDPALGVTLLAYSVEYTRDGGRPLVCGDSMVTGIEVCDDGNVVDGDGCSSNCTLEPGFMCNNAFRIDVGNATNAITPGFMSAWTTDAATGIKSLVVSSVRETCTKDDICVQGASWNKTRWWAEAYSLVLGGVQIPLQSLAPTGFYCNRFCTETFAPAKYYEFSDSCVPTGRDECSRGESTCDYNAYCTEPVTQVGFSCECDEKYFVSSPEGVACATAGVEVIFQMGGMLASDTLATEVRNLANMQAARLVIINTLITQGYVKAPSTPDLLLEGVKAYPIEMVRAVVTEIASPLLGRSLWRIVLRAPDIHLDLPKIAQGSIFDQVQVWTTIFNETDKYLMNEVGQCSNDRARSCSAAAVTCLNQGTCISNKADFVVRKLDAGGITAPLQVDSSGLDVMSVEYDNTQSAFKVRMRFDNTISGVINAVFVSHMGVDQDPLLLPTFHSDEFPCLPIGTGLFQNQRDNSGEPK